MRRAAKVLPFLIAVAVCGCGGGPSASQRRENATAGLWQRKATALLESGNCKGTIAYLNTVLDREPFWYELVSQAHMACWRQSGSSVYATAAVDIINQGLKVFPQSANLLLSRGYRRRELGDRQAALDDFIAAQAQARSNLAHDIAAQQDADRAVLKSASEAASQLRDTTVRERVEEQDILRTIASGNCETAIRRLQSTMSNKRNDIWFEQVFIANSFCFNLHGEASYRDAADAVLKDGLQRFPRSTRLLAACGAWNDAAGRKREAIDCYERALRNADLESEMPGGRNAMQRALDRLRASS